MSDRFSGTHQELETPSGRATQAKSIVIATGAKYRKLPLPNLSQFEGVGIYNGATSIEAQLCAGVAVVVVGAGNSASQAAIFLAEALSHVHLLFGSSHLADSMSRYLIRRIEDRPNISLHPQTGSLFQRVGAVHRSIVHLWPEDDYVVLQAEITYTTKRGMQIRLPYVNVLKSRTLDAHIGLSNPYRPATLLLGAFLGGSLNVPGAKARTCVIRSASVKG